MGRMSVLDDGSLRIRDVIPGDSGNYIAVASSAAGTDRLSYDVGVVGKSEKQKSSNCDCMPLLSRRAASIDSDHY